MKEIVTSSNKRYKICSNCLMLETRNRISFNEQGLCSACQWTEEKRTQVDWDKRQDELLKLIQKYKNDNGFDCIVPVSGGKDSSTVAHKLKHNYGLNPLCVNVSHSIATLADLNDINLNNFVKHGFELIRLYPNEIAQQKLDKNGLIKYGQPLFGWLTAMVLAPLKLGLKFNIPFIMYGEEGEVEYGGTTKLKNVPNYSIEDTIEFYLSGIDPRIYLQFFSEKELFWWLPPTEEEIIKLQPCVAHWSYFENWDSYVNYEYAKKNVGLKERETNSVGTYNGYAQTDCILYPLHTYFMYLKFGFGRCSQDVCIDIRSGRISREEGIELINKYDEVYPEIYEEQYLDYYQMTKKELYDIIDKFANKDLLIKKNGRWVKNFKLQ